MSRLVRIGLNFSELRPAFYGGPQCHLNNPKHHTNLALHRKGQKDKEWLPVLVAAAPGCSHARGMVHDSRMASNRLDLDGKRLVFNLKYSYNF
jgi:hypothetical protein